MAWLFVSVLMTMFAVVGLAFFWAPSRTFKIRALAAAVALAVVVVLVALIWKQAVVALAIAAVCSLAVAVMFQKVDPSRAISGAIAAFVLFFIFSWLAIQVSEPLFFHRQSDVSRWLESLWNQRHFDSYSSSSTWLAAIGLACLIGGSLLDRWLRASAVFVGVVLLCVFGPVVLDENGFSLLTSLRCTDPVLKVALLCLLVAGIVTLTRAIGSKHP